MSSLSSSSEIIAKAVCVIDASPATIYCCVCEQYYCDMDNANFHNSNPDLVGHMRLTLRPTRFSQELHAPPAPPSPIIQTTTTSQTPEHQKTPGEAKEVKEVTELNLETNDEAKHIGIGIVQGAEAFGRGIFGGITGIVLDPIRGGEKDGAAGVLKGAATGIGNAALKPMRGTGELLSRAAEGLRNTPTAIFSDDESEPKQHTEVKHVGEGLVIGTMNLGMGLFDGITGVVLDPIRGAEKDGVQGFFKGVGRGLFGVVCKPVAGAIDFVAKPIEGIANTPGTIADKIEEMTSNKNQTEQET